ncbi:lipid asymmetry maintenance protein MlaB [Seminibacterium arietis]|uniref:Lipid asymmetry maintenance protein MlaB n=1 Tax=Seminibacterium arietis TaxID=1173502 RepID=A0ABW3I935_9PAST
MYQEQKLAWDLEQNDDKIIIRLKGQLSVARLLLLWQQRSELLSVQNIANRQISWDLAALERIDSVGFALLCDFIHYCQNQHIYGQKIINAPSQLLTLADLFGLSCWLSPFLQHNGTDY